ncbi:MAG: 50S ribosomal protein L32e [Candidatus Methanomethylicia archaeon]|nr:50S ribosomal protein L32e [Candidatus Methanomethylicia archaeon]
MSNPEESQKKDAKTPRGDARAIKIRKKIAAKRPEFRRSEDFRFPRLGDKWRSSKGIRSKMRLKKKSRMPIVETGYRGPVEARGLNPKGLVEVTAFNVSDLEGIDPAVNAIRIAKAVGTKKRLEIIKAAQEKGLKVVNIRKSEKPKKEEEAAEAKEEGKAEEEAEAGTEEGTAAETGEAEEGARAGEGKEAQPAPEESGWDEADEEPAKGKGSASDDSADSGKEAEGR